MKVLVPLLLLIAQIAFATPYYANPDLKLIDKVSEVNKEWLTKDWDNPILSEQLVFHSDEAVIQTHLFLVEQYLRSHTPADLTSVQMTKRGAVLDILKSYAGRGLFPKNTHHDHRQPYFIDEFGTACAVGYLIIETGHEDLAQRVSKEMNYVYIREIPYPELLDWAKEYGFTVDELAWIQPAYSTPATYPYTSTGTGINGTVNTMQVDPVAEILYVGGSFQTSAPVSENLIAFDGDNWSTIGNPNGEVLNIEIVNGAVVVMGSFDQIDGISTGPIAMWDGQSWSAMGTGLVGSVRDIDPYNYSWFAAGEFTGWGQTVYLAKRPPNQGWSAAPWSFDGPIETLALFNDELLIGGYFKKVDGNDIPHLAFSDGATVYSDTAVAQPVKVLYTGGGKLYVGTDQVYEETYPDWTPAFFEAHKSQSTGKWTFETPFYGFYQSDTAQPFYVSDINTTPDGLSINGSFRCAYMYGRSGMNATMHLNQPLFGATSYALAWEMNGAVNAVAQFDGRYFVGGEFDSINGSDIPALASTSNDLVVTGIEPDPALSSYQLRTLTDGYIFVHTGSDFTPTKPAKVFNINGQMVDAIKPSDGQFAWTTASVPSGMYLVKLPLSDDRFAVQKVVVK